MVGPTASDVPPTMAVKIFSAGVAACVADAITFPLDTAKVRLQVASGIESGGIAGQRGDTHGVGPLDSGFALTTLSQADRAGVHLKNQFGLVTRLHAFGWETGTWPSSTEEPTKATEDGLTVITVTPPEVRVH